jgi:hypothetical protein
VWLHEEAARPRVILTGAILGAVPIGVVSLLLVGVGLLTIRPAPDGPSLRVALQTLLLLLPAAFLEELLSRGYLFATLREWLGSRTAIIVTSVGFGLLHLFNPNVSAMSIALVTLAGVYLAVVLLATQSLYAAWIAHFAWNWMMAGLLHVPVSGLPLSSPDYQIVDSGPDWITGGQWGPEGGAAAGLGILGGMAYLYWRSRLSALGSRRNEPLAESREPRAENRLLHLHSARLELGGPRLGIELVDREKVRRHLIGEVQRHENQTRFERVVDSGGRVDAAASRRDAHQISVSDPQALRVLGRDVHALAAVQR